MAETKKLLKEARKYIDQKNYKESVKLCRQILRRNEDTYMALVFLGKCFKQSDLARLALETAISNEPRNPLAWKGLAHYYENKEDLKAKVKLFPIYHSLLHKKLDSGKKVEIMVKVSQVGQLLKNPKSMKVILQFLDLHPTRDIYNAAVNELPKLLMSGTVFDRGDVEKAIQHIAFKASQHPERSLSLLTSQSIPRMSLNIDPLEVITRKICFDADIAFRITICKYICEQFVKYDTFGGFDIKLYKDVLTKGFEKHKYAILLKSMLSYTEGSYYRAYIQFAPLAFSKKIEYIEGIFMIKCNIKLGRWVIVEKIATEFGLGSDDNGYLLQLQKYKVLALAQQKKWDSAYEFGKKLPVTSLNIEEQAVLAKCYINNHRDAEHLINNLRSTHYYIQLRALYCMVQKKYRRAIALLEDAEPDAENYLYIAKSFWELKKFEKCLEYLTKSMDLNPKSAELNLYLGMWHHHYKPLYHKARRFYEKAYELNSSDNSIVRNLSDIYLTLNIRCNHLIILQTHCIFSPNQKWVHFRLGQLNMAIKNWEGALTEFLHHKREHPNDTMSLIYVAEANYKRQCYALAIENYKEVMNVLANQKIFCLTRIGYIYNSMCDYNTALKTFKEVFKIDPNYILAFKGAAKAWLRSSEAIADIRHYHIARDGYQVAVHHLIRGLSITKKLPIFWRILGNVMIQLANLPEGYSFVEVNFDDNDDLMDLGTVNLESSIVKLAEYCHWRATTDAPYILQRMRGRQISMEIIEDERNANPFRREREISYSETFTQWMYDYFTTYPDF